MEPRGSILVVDDDEDALALVTAILRRNDHDVTEATNGREAVGILRDRGEEIQLIILDLMMPGELDGYAVCEWIRTQPPAISETPVIILSARSAAEDMARSYASGAFQHIPKPCDTHHLLAVVNSMLRLKGFQEEAREHAAKFAAIFENAPIGILVVDPEQSILEMSRTLRERFPDVVPNSGRKAYEVLYTPPREEPDPECPVTAALENGEIRRNSFACTVGEETIWWDASAAPLIDQAGTITGAVLILQDVTPQREMEEQLRQEAERARKAEADARASAERHKANVRAQESMSQHMLEIQRDLMRKTNELEEAKERLTRLSVTDELTGLHNRRHFRERFELEVRRATRYYHPLSVIMLDIDHFKRVNDTHGHPVGDEVLQRLGHIIEEHLRETDIKARYGGEEFIMALPETTPEIARRIADRLRESIEEEVFETEAGPLSITASLGVASGLGDLDAESLVNQADKALYRAKRDGRNRVILYDEPA
jgi:two-component system cell cycle response regulator